MQEIQDKELTSLLHLCNKTGVVLEYVIFASDTAITTFESHRAVALAGMEVLAQRTEDRAKASASEEYPLEIFFKIVITKREITGTKITFDEFLNAKNTCPEQGYVTDGYKNAFFSPPHGLWCTKDDHLLLFHQLNNLLFSPGTDENLEIYRWSDDWSNYFDAGKEWWGTFYWTIFNKDKSQFIVVAGSTTD